MPSAITQQHVVRGLYGPGDLAGNDEVAAHTTQEADRVSLSSFRHVRNWKDRLNGLRSSWSLWMWRIIHNIMGMICGVYPAAGTTAKYILSITRAPSGRWLTEFQAARRRIPVISDLKAMRISLNLVPPVACVALLQTMLWEAGYQFVSIIPTWNRWPTLSGIPDIWVRDEIRKLGHFIGIELAAWNTAVKDPVYEVRNASMY
ncbi:hypothetical protein PHMEG_00012527 [Phytophthora megakarya]|uniref:Uncharacterized protein n=1 Tax=Phytophthora megakarya TaxID=4795 RepID=A0A225W9H8_9STRA|nr:hypothetical protein PHMEG_00012527 [Phytophthora megakarya]